MAIEFEGRTIATTATGYLENLEDWSEGLGQYLADEDGISLTDRHWDLLKFLRSEYIENNQNHPNTRKIVKAMADVWVEKIGQKDLYN